MSEGIKTLGGEEPTGVFAFLPERLRFYFLMVKQKIIGKTLVDSSFFYNFDP